MASRGVVEWAAAQGREATAAKLVAYVHGAASARLSVDKVARGGYGSVADSLIKRGIYNAIPFFGQDICA